MVTMRTPISQVGFSNRTYNALRRTGLNTVEDVIHYNREEFLNIRNLGAKSLDEIYKFLDEIDSETIPAELLSLPLEIEPQVISVLEYANSIKDDKHHNILLKRLQGITLEDIGKEYNVTRERVRQIVNKILKKRPLVLIEDKHIAVYETYNFSQADFLLAFETDITVYNYLTMVCDKKGTLPVSDLPADENFSIEIRKAAEKAAYKNYVTILNERVHKSRAALVDYTLRTYFTEEASFDDFLQTYATLLEDLGLTQTENNLEIHSRTYENKFLLHNKVLWKQGRRFRYYDIESYDFAELLQALSLSQYQNVEYSARKFFTDNPELMHRYDIRDEYELHNLLKKIYMGDNTTFGRMPMIEFGTANRDMQVMDMLINLAPISAQDLAAAYEKEYGIYSATFFANFTKCIAEYLHDGMYNISTPPLLPKQFTHMQTVLTDDFYETTDAKRIYQREFPTEPEHNINPYTLKTLGFNIYATYVLKNTYPSSAEYFRKLLTQNDLVDVQDFPPGSTGKQAYYIELGQLKSKYEIIEYESGKYINIRRLISSGITIEDIYDYLKKVVDKIALGEYFTAKSLTQNGFTHSLYDLGFSDTFYASLISEYSSHFAYQRIGGTKIFKRGKGTCTFKEFLTKIIEKETAIDIFDLAEILTNHYSIKLDRHKIIETVNNSTMHYDSIMEKVYVDYDTYFEEI